MLTSNINATVNETAVKCAREFRRKVEPTDSACGWYFLDFSLRVGRAAQQKLDIMHLKEKAKLEENPTNQLRCINNKKR